LNWRVQAPEQSRRPVSQHVPDANRMPHRFASIYQYLPRITLNRQPCS
jgi:hypothetical protein